MDFYSYSMSLHLPAAAIIIFASLVFLKLILRRKSNSSSSAAAGPPRPPPGPTKLPVIGNLHQLAAGGTLPHRRLRDLSIKYSGGVMGLQLGQVPHVVISSAESAKQVMKTHDIVFAQRPKLLAARIIGYDFSDIAFAPYGPYWRQLRKICVLELLTTKRVQSFGSIREEEVSNAVARIAADWVGREFNFSRMLFSLTNGIAARVTFGKKYNGQDEFILVMEEITRVVGAFNLADLFPAVASPLQHVTGIRSKLLRLRDEAGVMLGTIIADHRREQDYVADDDPHQVVDDDLVDVLLKLVGPYKLSGPTRTVK